MTVSDPGQIAGLLRAFAGSKLTRTLSVIEGSVGGTTAADCPDFLLRTGATKEMLEAAAAVKNLAGQINVTIHALGILLCLPHILLDDERVEYVSLGAGNTGKEFDLETNRRVAEFKFIQWRGGPESIRQNSIFKDFFLLADSESPKQKFLYLLGTEHPLRFLNGGRAIRSVLSRDERVRNLFLARFGDRYLKVREYYNAHRDEVLIQDVSPWLPELAIVSVVDPLEPSED